jgi:hypothetical protein
MLCPRDSWEIKKMRRRSIFNSPFFLFGSVVLGLFAAVFFRPADAQADAAARRLRAELVAPQSVTCADNGVGASAAACSMPVPSTSGVRQLQFVTCSDVDGCNYTLTETSIVIGQELVIVNISANMVNIADSVGVSETAGAFAMGARDIISFVYVTDVWVESSRSNN